MATEAFPLSWPDGWPKTRPKINDHLGRLEAQYHRAPAVEANPVMGQGGGHQRGPVAHAPAGGAGTWEGGESRAVRLLWRHGGHCREELQDGAEMTLEQKMVAEIQGIKDARLQKIAEGSADGYWDHLKSTIPVLDAILAKLQPDTLAEVRARGMSVMRRPRARD